MVTCPTVHDPATTAAQLRTFFTDEHVHAALVADADKLIGVVERADLTDLDDDTQAGTIARLDGRTILPTESVPRVLQAMKRSGRRRLAVVGDDGALLGLLCLKASGRGFCSDADVLNRASDRTPGRPARSPEDGPKPRRRTSRAPSSARELL
jgi:CBS-domain-containing membrane protein